MKERGFTLIEVLVALAILALGMGLVLNGNFSSRDRLEDVTSKLERAIRFATDEALVRNAVTRLHLVMDGDKHSFTIEAGPDGQFMLPEDFFKEKPDEKELKKEKEELNKKFNRIREFDDGAIELDEDIKIAGIGTSLTKKFINQGEADLYFYPSGERDEALIVISSEEEMISLQVESFSSDIERKYHPLEKENDATLEDVQASLLKGLFDEWRKN